MHHSEKIFCEGCGEEMSNKHFMKEIMYYCLTCGTYKRVSKECNHDYILILFKLENGSYQLRKYCRICQIRDANILKKSDYDTSGLLVKEERNYREYYDNIMNNESEIKASIFKQLHDIQEEVMFADYTRYIKSEDWFKLRSKIVNRDGGLCQICGKPADHVHHLTYAHFTKEFPFELVSLCRDCHQNEYHSSEAKRRENEILKPSNVTT